MVFGLAILPAVAQEVTWHEGPSSNFVTRDTQGNWFTVATGGQDLLVQKHDPLHQLLWTRVLGGTGAEELRALTVDANGALLLLGNTTSKDFPVTPGVLSPTAPSGTVVAFLLKLAPQGEIAFSTYLYNGAAIPAESLLRADEDQITLALSGRLWRLDQNATRRISEVTSPYITGPMELDALGHLWIAGTTQDDNLPVSSNAFQPTRHSGTCYAIIGPINCATGFLMRLNAATGAVEAATYLGGKAQASITAIAVDSTGAPIVTGNVRGGAGADDFPTTPGSFQPAVKSRGASPWFISRDNFLSTPFVARLTPDLSQLAYATYLAGSRAERATWLSVDPQGRPIIAGDTVSRDFPGTGAFAKPCGPDRGPNPPSSGFVARLSADGSALESGTLLFSTTTGRPFAADGATIAAPTPTGLAQVSLDAPDHPVVACTVNGASFRVENFLAPGQLITLLGAGFPNDKQLLFDGIPAQILYLAPDQINAVVPAELQRRETTQMALEGASPRTFEVRLTNPTIKVFVHADGTLEDRGNPLADIRLENGAQNGTANPAHRGEWIDIYTTGIDPNQPVEVYLPDHIAPPTTASMVEGTAGGIQKLRVRIPATANGGMVTIAIVNGGQRSANNGGFVWVE